MISGSRPKWDSPTVKPKRQKPVYIQRNHETKGSRQAYCYRCNGDHIWETPCLAWEAAG